MKINELTESTTAGAIATVAAPMSTQSRSGVGKGIYGNEKPGTLLTGKKTSKKYANSISENKMYVKKLTAKEEVTAHAQQVMEAKHQYENITPRWYRGPMALSNTLVALGKKAINESKHISDGREVIELMKRLDQFEKISPKVGSSVAVITGQLTGNSMELWGFTTPKTITKIYREPSDGSIKQFEFNNDPEDVYPRVDNAEYDGNFMLNSMFFSDKKSAEHALTMITLQASGDLAISNSVTEEKSITEAGTFTSKQQVIDHFVKNGKTAAQGASAWERGWRGKSKTSNTPVANKPRTDWMAKHEVNEAIQLKFHTTELLPDQYWNYVIAHFEQNNINRSHPSYITNLRTIKESRYKLTESQEFEDIQPFIRAINRIDSKKTIKVGDKFAVLNFEIIYYHKEIIVYGFTKPTTVAAVKLHADGTINKIRFEDGSVYPRQNKVTLNKRSIEQAAYFETEKEAEHALTMLRLSLPDEWDFDSSGLNVPIDRKGIKENNMKIEDLSEQDLILIPGQGHKLKTGLHAFDPDKAEHEGETLKNSLRTIARNAKELHSRLENHDQFPEWVSEKIGAIKGMMTAVTEYLVSSQEPAESAGVIAGGGVGESEEAPTLNVPEEFKKGQIVYLKTRPQPNAPYQGKIDKIGTNFIILNCGGGRRYKARRDNVTADSKQSYLHVKYGKDRENQA